MMSYIPDVLLKPVSAMTSKCGFPLSHQQTPESATSHRIISTNTPPSAPVEKTTRCVSNASTSADDSSDSPLTSQESFDEICIRMAGHGIAARRAGRHVLVGNRLVLS